MEVVEDANDLLGRKEFARGMSVSVDDHLVLSAVWTAIVLCSIAIGLLVRLIEIR
jgi:hypothetical protein